MSLSVFSGFIAALSSDTLNAVYIKLNLQPHTLARVYVAMSALF